MFSFSTISVFATLACAALSSAIPLSNQGSRPTALAVRDEPRSLPVILLDVSTKIGPVCDKLKGIVTARATVEVVTPLVDELKVTLSGAIVEVQALKDHPIEFVLSLHNRVLTIRECAQVVALLFTIIYGALGAVLSVCATAQYKVVFPLLVDVGLVAGELLINVLLTVDGLLVVVCPLLECIFDVILKLQLTAVIHVLGIHN